MKKNKYAELINLQNEMQIKVLGEEWWKSKDAPYDIAMIKEASEMLDHLRWEWWKDLGPERDEQVQIRNKQLQLEVVDILHFKLCDIVQKYYNVYMAANEDISESDLLLHSAYYLEDSFNAGYISKLIENKRLIECIVDFIKDSSMINFIALAIKTDLSFEELHLLYIAKAALNKFRQDNGYKKGTYVKIWDGQEDNVHLVENILPTLKDPGIDEIYKALDIYYKHAHTL